MKLVRSNPTSLLHNHPWFNLDSVFSDDLFHSLQSESHGMNVFEDDDNVYVEVAVPGLSEDDVDVSLHEGVLRVRGAREESDEKKTKKGVKVYSSSMRSSFSYSTSLPSNVDATKVDAELENGVLRLTVGKKPESKPRKISVKKK